MSTTYLKKRLLRLNRRHGELLEQILQLRPILRGSFTRVHTRCGKANCWCAESPKGHQHERITWSENGILTTRKVPAEQTGRVVALTDNYRQFRTLRRKLVALNGEIRNVLDQYEKALINQARKPLGFLDAARKVTAATSKKRQTGQALHKGPM